MGQFQEVLILGAPATKDTVFNPLNQRTVETGLAQEAKYVERWPNTTSAWTGFDIPVDRYGGVHSLLICTSSPLGFPTCHRGSQQENTY
jgi:hypothetical protein